MPTVPNRYYNSPWIAQAATNLSDAMFGNPDRELQSLQAQQIRQSMERQTMLDEVAAQEREQQQIAQMRLGDVVTAQPGMVPEYSRLALAAGNKPMDVFYAGGTGSATYQQKSGLQRERLLAKIDELNLTGEQKYALQQLVGMQDIDEIGLRNQGALDVAGLRGENDIIRAIIALSGVTQGHASAERIAEENRKSAERIQQARGVVQREVARFQASAAGKGAKFSVSDLDAAAEHLAKYASKHGGGRLSAQQQSAIMDKWGIYFTHPESPYVSNSPSAFRQAWTEIMGYDPETEGLFSDAMIPGATKAPPAMTPNAGAPAEPERTVDMMAGRGGSASPIAPAAAAPAAAAPAQPREGERRQSKGGKPMIYSGGKWRYE